MIRKIVSIDESKCDGCGLCAKGCAEGAISIIDGKARLAAENYCDGLGACIGVCPRGAISVTERQAEAYDERKTMENLVKAGDRAVLEHLRHLYLHGKEGFLRQAVEFLNERGAAVPDFRQAAGHSCGGHSCPGARTIDRRGKPAAGDCGPGRERQSQLRQWPVQLKLLNPAAPYFKGADLLVAADCVPFACAGFHEKLLKGKILVVFCPKLDSDMEGYAAKLAEVFKSSGIRSVTVAHMEVPCCSAALILVREALRRSGVPMEVGDVTVTLDGAVIQK